MRQLVMAGFQHHNGDGLRSGSSCSGNQRSEHIPCNGQSAEGHDFVPPGACKLSTSRLVSRCRFGLRPHWELQSAIEHATWRAPTPYTSVFFEPDTATGMRKRSGVSRQAAQTAGQR